MGVPEGGVFLPVNVSTQNLMGGPSSLVIQSEKKTESETDDEPWTPFDYLIAAGQTIIFCPCICLLSTASGCDEKKNQKIIRGRHLLLSGLKNTCIWGVKGVFLR